MIRTKKMERRGRANNHNVWKLVSDAASSVHLLGAKLRHPAQARNTYNGAFMQQHLLLPTTYRPSLQPAGGHQLSQPLTPLCDRALGATYGKSRITARQTSLEQVKHPFVVFVNWDVGIVQNIMEFGIGCVDSGKQLLTLMRA